MTVLFGQNNEFAGKMEMPGPATSIITCSDVDELKGLMPGSSFTLLPLGQGPFRAEVVFWELGDVSLCVGHSTPSLAFGRVAPDRMHLFLPLTGHGQMILLGHRVERHDIAVACSGGPLDGTNQGEADWATVIVPVGTARHMLLPPGRSLELAAGQQYLLRTAPSAWNAAASLLCSARGVFLEEPAIFNSAEPRRALRDSLFVALRNLLAGPECAARPRLLRTSRNRRHLIEQADAYITAHPGHATSLAALSRGIGISPARLRAAYSASFGVDPELFLTLRRLALIRSKLKSCAGRHQGFRHIAQTHGFSHFTEFARDYHRVFGEPVSQDDNEQAWPA